MEPGRLAGGGLCFAEMAPPHVPDDTYHEGAVLEIQRHLPPEPFGIVGRIRYKLPEKRSEWNAFWSSATYWCRKSRVELILAHPPITTTEVKNPESRKFTITQIIQFNEHTEGQTVFEGVIISANGKRNEVIAKVHDGAYYSLDERFGNSCDTACPDVMTKADLHYYTESSRI
ncbi:hypothetical protein QC764_0030900 [Podospora pseudoanserina]|uniref:Uncharacterized protein n=1 Tax=Podospora pseudoanserina TaxID=2609844 RepID=A0ABR0IF80_9PEZI|nr:hypothetical protein QC764_0030900 [Podospora pseudoanserina]